MPTVVSFSREARVHARRFVSHLAISAEPASSELVQLWKMVDRGYLSEARSRVADLLGSLIDNAELQSDDVTLLLGLAYLRLQYLLGVQRVGGDIEVLLRDPERMQTQLSKAFEAIEPDLLSALTQTSKEMLGEPLVRNTVGSAFQHLIHLSKKTSELDEAVGLPAQLFPVELHRASSTGLTLMILIIVNLWPNKTNTPDPKFPGGGGGGKDGGPPK
jgi:hypothetical protein